MRHSTLALVLLLGMLAAACGTADSLTPAAPVQSGPTVAVIPYVPDATPIPYVPGATPIPASSATPTAEPTAIATAQPTPAGTPAPSGPELWAAEFRYADVPAGWSRSPVNNELLLQQATVVCDGKWLTDPAYYQTSAGIEFAQSDAGPILIQSLWQSDSVADAQKEMAFNRETYNCSTWEETTASGQAVVFRIQPLTISSVGDESAAARETVELAGKSVLEIEVVYLRVGPVLCQVTLAGGAPVDPGLLASLAKTAVQRIHDAGF